MIVVVSTVVPPPSCVLTLLTKKESVFHWVICHFKRCYYFSCLPSTSSHHAIFVTSFHINAGEEMSTRGEASSNLIGCLKLNWDHGCVDCGASSFVGVYSLNKTRFCFLLGYQALLVLLSIHATSSASACETFHVVTTF